MISVHNGQFGTCAATTSAIAISAELEHRDPPRPGAMKYRSGKTNVVRRPVPGLRAGDALVRIKYASVCGSDVHAVQHDADGWCRSSVPAANWERPGGLVLGHEYTGIVIAVGKTVDRSWIGRAVTGDSLVPCRRCDVCRDGFPNECPDSYLIGLEADGTFSELAVVPASTLHAIDDLLSAIGNRGWMYGALAEPLGVAGKAIDEGLWALHQRLPRKLAVIGGGPLGICCAMIGRVQGIDSITIVEPEPERREIAERCGFTAVGIGGLDKRANLVIDAAGAVAADDLLADVGPAGVVVELARTGQSDLVPRDDSMTRGIKFAYSRGHVGFLPKVLGWMADGRLDPQPLITRELDGLCELHTWLSAPDRFLAHGKVVVRIDQGDET